jgi:hypothetical protein
MPAGAPVTAAACDACAPAPAAPPLSRPAPGPSAPAHRTAGRTFHTCLLKQGTPPAERCPKSYDHLRIDVQIPSCKLLSSHDDFSVVQALPPGTAVVTQLREPVERFLSAYEFAVEVGPAAAWRAQRRAREGQGARRGRRPGEGGLGP